MVSLIDMPEVPMKVILEKLEYVEIQCLRKTCVSLRNFIDDTRPEQPITALEISGSHGKKKSLLIYGNDDPQLYPNGQKIHIEYQKIDGENTKITWFRKDKNRQKTFYKENFLDIFSRDFGQILRSKLPILRHFSMDFQGIPQNFLEKLHFKEHPIKTDALILKNATCQEDILSVLPYACADTLKHLEITFVLLGLDISKILELEQWKKADEVHLDGEPVLAGIQNFENFSYAEIQMNVVELEDMLRLQELFLHTPSTTKQIRIHFRQLSDRDAFIQEFGPPIENNFTFYDVRSKTSYLERPDDMENFVAIGFFENCFDIRVIKNYNNPPIFD